MRYILLLSASAAALCGCATPVDAPLGSTFGQAFASMNAQIIPAPVSALPPEDSGARAALGIARADKGAPKQPMTEGTSNTKITLVPYAPEK